MFQNREDAGQQLAKALIHYKNQKNTLVLGLPRGGVVVAYEVSQALHLPLDAILVRKLGVPGQEELAMGAIAMPDTLVLEDDIIHALQISQNTISAVKRHEKEILEYRNQLYRGGKAIPDFTDKTLILIDDGLATGSTMLAAVKTVKTTHPARIVIAIPVAPPDTTGKFKSLVDEIICLEKPKIFMSIGQWYDEFSQTTDEEVISRLTKRP